MPEDLWIYLYGFLWGFGRGTPSPLRSGRRKADVHRTSCAPRSNPENRFRIEIIGELCWFSGFPLPPLRGRRKISPLARVMSPRNAPAYGWVFIIYNIIYGISLYGPLVTLISRLSVQNLLSFPLDWSMLCQNRF